MCGFGTPLFSHFGPQSARKQESRQNRARNRVLCGNTETERVWLVRFQRCFRHTREVTPKRRVGTQGYIEELIDEELFAKPKTIVAVKAELGNRGHHIPLTSLSGASKISASKSDCVERKLRQPMVVRRRLPIRTGNAKE